MGVGAGAKIYTQPPLRDTHCHMLASVRQQKWSVRGGDGTILTAATLLVLVLTCLVFLSVCVSDLSAAASVRDGTDSARRLK